MISTQRLEEKGQLWLAARCSSTTLDGAGEGEDDESYSGFPRDQQRRVDTGSRDARSRLSNRRGSMHHLSSSSSRRGSAVDALCERETQIDGPDFVDGFDLEEQNEDGDGDGDGEDVDEGEMRRIVMGRIGGWVDWAVGWMDMRDLGEDEDDDDDNHDHNEDQHRQEDGEGVEHRKAIIHRNDTQYGAVSTSTKGNMDPVELQKRLRRRNDRDGDEEKGAHQIGVPAPPPDGHAGVWSDTKWLLGVARRAVV